MCAWMKHHTVSEVILVRYADDFVVGFRGETDARNCLGCVLKDGFTQFGFDLASREDSPN